MGYTFAFVFRSKEALVVDTMAEEEGYDSVGGNLQAFDVANFTGESADLEECVFSEEVITGDDFEESPLFESVRGVVTNEGLYNVWVMCLESKDDAQDVAHRLVKSMMDDDSEYLDSDEIRILGVYGYRYTFNGHL